MFIQLINLLFKYPDIDRSIWICLLSCGLVLTMSKRTSPIWAYFTKQDDGKITCNLCKTQLADRGGTLNLQKHERKTRGQSQKMFG